MKTVHKRKAERVGQIIRGVDARIQLQPHLSLECMEELTIVRLDEEIRLGEIALKGTTTRSDPGSPYYESK